MLRAVLPVLIEHRSSVDWWSFGGGAALAHHLHHRISYDIDLFVDSAKDLKALVPNVNPLMKKLAGANKYEYLGNHLKVPYGSPPIGEINIIIAASVSDHPFEPFSFNGQDIRIETIDEILAKKCLFKASRFTNRDMFDLAASLDKDPTVLSRLQPAIQETLPLLEDRIREWRQPTRRLTALQDLRNIACPMKDPDDSGRFATRIVDDHIGEAGQNQKPISLAGEIWARYPYVRMSADSFCRIGYRLSQRQGRDRIVLGNPADGLNKIVPRLWR